MMHEWGWGSNCAPRAEMLTWTVWAGRGLRVTQRCQVPGENKMEKIEGQHTKRAEGTSEQCSRYLRTLMASLELYVVFRGHGSLLKVTPLLASLEEVNFWGHVSPHPFLPAPGVGQISWCIYPPPLHSGTEFDHRDWSIAQEDSNSPQQALEQTFKMGTFKMKLDNMLGHLV